MFNVHRSCVELQLIDFEQTAMEALEQAIKSMAGKQATRTKLLNQLSITAVQAMIQHVSLLLEGPRAVVTKSSILQSIDVSNAQQPDTIRPPFGPPRAKPDNHSQVHVSGHAQSKAVRNYLAQQPGRQSHIVKPAEPSAPAPAADNPSDGDASGQQNVEQKHPTTFAAILAETPFLPDDSTKSKKRRQKRKPASTAVDLPPAQTIAQQRRAQQQLQEEQQRQAESQLDEAAQAELRSLRETRMALNDSQQRSNAKKSGVHAFQRRIFPSPGSNIFRHLTASAAGQAVTPGERYHGPDHSVDQFLVWVADCTNKAFASVNRAVTLYLQTLAGTTSKEGRRAVLAPKVMPETIKVLVNAMTLPHTLINANIDALAPSGQDLGLAYRALAKQCVATEQPAQDANSARLAAMEEDLRGLNILPLTWRTIVGLPKPDSRSPNPDLPLPRHLDLAMVVAINQTFQEGYPWVTASHLGLPGRARTHASNIASYLSRMAVKSAELATRHFFQMFFGLDPPLLSTGNNTTLFNIFLQWALHQELGSSPQQASEAANTATRSFIADLDISDRRKDQVSDAVSSAAKRLINYITPYARALNNNALDVSMRSMLTAENMIPCDFLSFVQDTCSLSKSEFALVSIAILLACGLVC